MEEENYKIIEENLKFFDEFDLNLNSNDLITINIDELYAKIILALIEKNFFQNYEESKTIIAQFDFQSIDITKKIFDVINDYFTFTENRFIKSAYIALCFPS